LHEGEELLFCCRGCCDGFQTDPARYLAEIRDTIVCPTCLAEKARDLAVAIDYNGDPLYFCRCPGCIERFKEDPEPLLARLAL
jgi:YHS domain-containing protein